MNKFVSFTAVGAVAISLGGCAGLMQPSVQKIDEEEAFKYEKQYLAEWEQLKARIANLEPNVRYVQPKNKKQACKVYVAIEPNDDKTAKSDYELFWDGECKDGYASGIGREIEHTAATDLQQIGFYEGGKAVDYCVMIDKPNGMTIEGECHYGFDKANHGAKMTVQETATDINIAYQTGSFGSKNEPAKFMNTWAFADAVYYVEEYPNFAYRIMDTSKDEFHGANAGFDVFKNGKVNGYSIALYKNGQSKSAEMVDDQIVKFVQLPNSYLQRANDILNEIKSEVNIALQAQQKARAVKEKYLAKICKSSVKVNFMDDEEYKAICHEKEEFARLQPKINAKLAQIEQAKQNKREQIYRERIARAAERQVQAAESQAAAAQWQAQSAQTQAYAAQQANRQRRLDMWELNQNLRGINSSLQGIRQNTTTYNPFAPQYTQY